MADSVNNRRQSGLWKQNPQTGFYEQVQPAAKVQGPYQYYEPPPPRPTQQDVRTQPTFDRASNTNGANGMLRSDSSKLRDSLPESLTRPLHKLRQIDATIPTSEQFAQTKHVNSTRLPGSAQQEPLRIDPDAVPPNLRSAPWSPDPASPRSQEQTQALQQPSRHTSTTSNASDLVRRGSVPDRSPLQRLEADLASKEKKRARVEEAEQRARHKSLGGEGALLRQGTLRSQKDRSVSDGSRAPDRAAPDTRRDEERPRHVSAGASLEGESGAHRFRRATENLRNEVSHPQEPEQRQEPRRNELSANDTRTQVPESYRSKAAGKRPYEAPETQRRVQIPGTEPAYVSARDPQDYNHQQNAPENDPYADGSLGRTGSQKYRHRARDAGFIGASAAIAGASAAAAETAAERGKAVYERRKSQTSNSPPVSPITPTAPTMVGNRDVGLGRSESKKIQKQAPPPTEWYGKGESSFKGPELHESRNQREQASSGSQRERADLNQPIASRASTQQGSITARDGPGYRFAPQATATQTLEPDGFGKPQRPLQQQENHHALRDDPRPTQQMQNRLRAAQPLEEWRDAKAVKLTAGELEFDQIQDDASPGAMDKEDAWWEKSNRKASSSGSRQASVQAAQYDGPYEEEATRFRPPLYLKCGPLLRYTGMRHDKAGGEIWRGSVMIVTEDDQSDYSPAPTLRLFSQEMDLLVPPSRELLDSGHELPPEYEDPVAGQIKLSRTGRPLFVRHVHEIHHGVDLSRKEDPQGLYAATRTPMLGPQGAAGPDERASQHITFQDKSRVKRNSGERAGKYRDVKAVRLHVDRGYTFWRFNIEIELGSQQHRVAYRINKGPAIGFWIPARGETMNVMFHSCNGFSASVNPSSFCGPDPLWRDVLNRHQSKPFHVMIGGGDQIYNDAVTRESALFEEWLETRNLEDKFAAQFTPQMQDQLEYFYLNHYAMWFSQGLFAMATSQIPMVNIWDDHDIFDGYGSYPHQDMSSAVLRGLGSVAFKYYLLFQHQSVVAETTREEPSWLLGARPGPYIGEFSRSVFVQLGRKVAFLGLDCRTERTREQILCEDTYNAVFDRLKHGLAMHSEIKHLIVLLGVPIAYPRLNFLENVLTSRFMDPIRSIGRVGVLGGFVNKFDGGIEILDDLDDHWTSKLHKGERNWFVKELQELAAEKSVRITILSGDVHLGAVGQFYTPKAFGLRKDKDHRYMVNVISSAIVNTPPPAMMADVLNRRNRVHHLDQQTDEDLIPLFDTDVNGARRGNKHLLPRRNYCTIKEYISGASAPPTPRQDAVPGTSMSNDIYPPMDGGENGARDRRFPPGSMNRTMSLTRGPAMLVRRLSASARNRGPPVALAPEHARPYDSHESDSAPVQRSHSMSGPRPDQGSNFPPPDEQKPRNPRNQLFRRATTWSVREARQAAAKGGPDGGNLDGREERDIDLDGGLDISLNMEIDQHDPSGSTVSYRLLVPALSYEGPPEEARDERGGVRPPPMQGRRVTFMNRMRARRRHEIGEDGYSRSPTPSPPPNGSEAQQYPPGMNDSMEAHVSPYDPAVQPPHAAQPGSSTRDAARNVSGPPQTHAAPSAYNKGYNLSSPPIGHPHPGPQPPNLNIAQQAPFGSRRASAPVQPRSQPANDPWLDDDDDDDDDERTEGSLTPEVANHRALRPGMQGRRPSKVERFLGIGQDRGPWGGNGGQRVEMEHDEREDLPVRKRPAWLVWR